MFADGPNRSLLAGPISASEAAYRLLDTDGLTPKFGSSPQCWALSRIRQSA
jgi:hypothetical protein